MLVIFNCGLFMFEIRFLISSADSEKGSGLIVKRANSKPELNMLTVIVPFGSSFLGVILISVFLVSVVCSVSIT